MSYDEYLMEVRDMVESGALPPTEVAELALAVDFTRGELIKNGKSCVLSDVEMAEQIKKYCGLRTYNRLLPTMKQVCPSMSDTPQISFY